MRSTQTSLFCAIAVLGLSLMAAGCSDNQSETESVDSAEQRVEQANAELEQAQQNLADTKAEAKAKADAETESSNKASATNTQQTTKRETTSSREQSASRPAERSSTPADSEAREQASTSSAPPVCDGAEAAAAGSSPASSTTPPVGLTPYIVMWRSASVARSTPGALPYQTPTTPSCLRRPVGRSVWLPHTDVAAISSLTAGWR